MLNRIKRPSRQRPTTTGITLQIGNLLDHPGLREAMAVDAEATGGTHARTKHVDLPPLVNLEFDRSSLLEPA